jgi:hypothetical protein
MVCGRELKMNLARASALINGKQDIIVWVMEASCAMFMEPGGDVQGFAFTSL